MFATQIIAGIDTQIDASTARIAELESLLATEREAKKALEFEKQKLLTISKAGESALAQVANFLAMTKNSGETQIESAFWDYLDTMRNTTSVLNAVETTESESESDTETATVESEGELRHYSDVEVEIEVESETTETTAIEVESDTAAVDTETIAYSQLMRSDYEQLKAIARLKGITPKGGKSKLCSALRGLVSEHDFDVVA